VAELEPAFGDTSALVSLCIQQKGSNAVEQLSNEYSIIAWWAAPVEIRSAFARLLRMGLLSPVEYQQAQKQVEVLRQSWREIQPHDSVRSLAGSLLHQFPLRAADALQGVNT
jgi:predicted nucleic acid-binding protein